MLRVLFTLDYEIHGNGEGRPYELMIEPTARLLRLFDAHGAKLTIMADIAEILKFKEHAEHGPEDTFCYRDIVAQLQDAVVRGHDVQLHVHSSYFNATFDGQRWVQDWSEYNFAGLALDRMTGMVQQGREFLESILRPVKADYRCIAFRAANWSVSPARNVVKALLENGIRIDTSIFKFGRRAGLVAFDYSGAHSDLVPWPASEADLCVKDPRSRLWEFPIYSEERWMGAFLTANRVCRVAQSARHRIERPPPGSGSRGPAETARPSLAERLSRFAKKQAWKADFNQCTGAQLIGALHRAERKTEGMTAEVPFILIGHSKIFTRWNAHSLQPLLEHVESHPDRFGFGTFANFVGRGTVMPNEVSTA